MNIEHPLIMASSEGNLNRVKNLLDMGYDINIQNIIGWTPLVSAILFDKREVTIELLKRGSEISFRGGRNLILHCLMKFRDCDILDILVERDINFNIKDSSGNTFLHTAVSRIDLSLEMKDNIFISKLISCGTDPRIKNDGGQKAINLFTKKDEITSKIYEILNEGEKKLNMNKVPSLIYLMFSNFSNVSNAPKVSDIVYIKILYEYFERLFDKREIITFVNLYRK